MPSLLSAQTLSLLSNPQKNGFEWMQHRYRVKSAWKLFCATEQPTLPHYMAYNILLGRPLHIGFPKVSNSKKIKSGYQKSQQVYVGLWSLITGMEEQWKPFAASKQVWDDPECAVLWRQYLSQQYKLVKDQENDMSDLRKGVCVLFVNNNKCLTVTRSDGPGVCMPGGKLEQGETFVDAACREIWEETSLRIDPSQLISIYRGVCDHNEKDDAPFDVECFWAFDFDGVERQQEDGIEPRWVSAQELLLNSPFNEYNMHVLNKFKEKFPSAGEKLLQSSELSYDKPSKPLSL